MDSLGNVVALLPSDNLRNLVQENAYDPWGLNLPDLERSAVLPDWWQFSTKERDYRAYDEFEFRQYDAAIGRFMSIDPLFQQFRGISPFNYADNNPSTFIDLYGLQGTTPAPPGKVTAFGSSGNIATNAGGSGGFLSGLSNGLNAIGNFLSTPLGGVINFGIQASVALNQPASAASYNLNSLNVGCPPNCPQKRAEFREYRPDVYDQGKKGNIRDQSGRDPNFDNSKLALDIGGGIYGGLQGMTSSQSLWLGKNGKYYSNSWGGNRYTGSRSGAFKVANQYKMAGKAVLGVTAVIGGIETYQGYQMDGGQFGYNSQSAAAQTVGNIAGGLAGAEVGMFIGGGIGSLFFGVGAVPGAAVGGFVGGLIGGNLGGSVGQSSINWYHGR